MIRDKTTQFGHGFAIIFVPPSSGSSFLLLGKTSLYKSSAKSVAVLLTMMMMMPPCFLAFSLFLYLFLNLLEIDLHSVTVT